MIRVVDGLIGLNEAKPILREMNIFALLSQNDWHWNCHTETCEMYKNERKLRYINYGTRFKKIFALKNYCWNELWSPKCEVVSGISFKSVSFFENENLRTDNQATPFSSLTNFISKSERTSYGRMQVILEYSPFPTYYCRRLNER